MFSVFERGGIRTRVSFRSSDQKSDPFDRARAPALDSVRVFVLEERGGGGGKEEKEGGRRKEAVEKKKESETRQFSMETKKRWAEKKESLSSVSSPRDQQKKTHPARQRNTDS